MVNESQSPEEIREEIEYSINKRIIEIEYQIKCLQEECEHLKKVLE